MGREKSEEIRVRFAPSPTGELHIGGARTALFNWLFARDRGGKFVLRIEDTDVARSQENFTQSIIRDLKWLGLNWDEGPQVGGEYGPYFQSERTSIYSEFAGRLLKSGQAYLCFCTPEELEERRKDMHKLGKSPRDDEPCRNLSSEEKNRLKKQGRKPAVRFKVTREDKIVVEDLLKGRVVFDCQTLGDFILIKSNGLPAFNFANVIDDTLMRINYVIRGDDHLSNTPRQILIYQALGFSPPAFAHLPMILGSDGSRLSKRHGATSISYYCEQGYLPWALVNYLALLGWSTVDSQQLFEPDELIEKFTLKKVGKSAAIFDVNKLKWMCGEYIRRFKPEELLELLFPYFGKLFDIPEKLSLMERERLLEIVKLEQERIRILSEIDKAEFFFNSNFSYDEKAVNKRLKRDYVIDLLKLLKEKIDKLSSFTKNSLEGEIRSTAEELSLSTSKVFHPLRVSLTGKMQGPGLFEVAVTLGKKEVLRRIDRTLQMLKDTK